MQYAEETNLLDQNFDFLDVLSLYFSSINAGEIKFFFLNHLINSSFNRQHNSQALMKFKLFNDST